jgi:hypothetical protein
MSLTYIFLLMLYMQQDNTHLLPLFCGVIKRMLHSTLTLNGCISSVVLSNFLNIFVQFEKTYRYYKTHNYSHAHALRCLQPHNG